MVRAWYFNEEADEPAIGPHMPDPPSFLSLEEVQNKTGLEYFQFPVETIDTNPDFAELKRKRGYTYEDEICVSPTTLPDFEEKKKIFSAEHVHVDNEIRFVINGGGFFDIRDAKAEGDKWIRLEIQAGDLLILPAGIYHRFTLDQRNIIEVKRLFSTEPCWKAVNRPFADELPARKEYMKRMASVN